MGLAKEIFYFIVDKINRSFKVKKYLNLNPINLNLGCGKNLKQGFINIDISKGSNLRLDLRKRLPFKKNSVDYIYSEHFFEHISYTDKTAILCLYDYLRILKQGGKIKIVIPDMESCFKAYTNKDFNYFNRLGVEKLIPQSKKYFSIIDNINYAVYQFGEHKYCYDYEKMNLLLKSVGFKNIKKDKFNPSEDTEFRKYYSMYIIAQKNNQIFNRLK